MSNLELIAWTVVALVACFGMVWIADSHKPWEYDDDDDEYK